MRKARRSPTMKFVQDPATGAVTGYFDTPLPDDFEDCGVYWGSHGCCKERGHRGAHECDCCQCGLFHRFIHRRRGCVAKPPYYGKNTHFYGDPDDQNRGRR